MYFTYNGSENLTSYTHDTIAFSTITEDSWIYNQEIATLCQMTIAYFTYFPLSTAAEIAGRKL